MNNFFSDIINFISNIFLTILRGFSPLIIGLFLSYLLYPTVEWVRTKIGGSCQSLHCETPKRRVAAIFITYIAIIIIILLILWAFIFLTIGALPSGNINSIIEKLYDYFFAFYDSITGFLGDYLPNFSGDNSFSPVEFLQDWLMQFFSFEIFLEIISGITGAIVNIFIGTIISIYLIKDREFFISLWQKFLSLILKQHSHGVINDILYEINEILLVFFRTAVLDGIIVALLTSLLLSVIKVKYAVIIGIIGGILNIIPYFGPFLGMIPAFLVAFATGGIWRAIIAVLAILAIQQIDSNYIYPKIVGTSIGLHPLFVLLAVSFFGYFGGVLGMLLAVPIACIVQVVVVRWAYKK
jgi:predicted PurR-regulated permease PerM